MMLLTFHYPVATVRSRRLARVHQPYGPGSGVATGSQPGRPPHSILMMIHMYSSAPILPQLTRSKLNRIPGRQFPGKTAALAAQARHLEATHRRCSGIGGFMVFGSPTERNCGCRHVVCAALLLIRLCTTDTLLLLLSPVGAGCATRLRSSSPGPNRWKAPVAGRCAQAERLASGISCNTAWAGNLWQRCKGR